MELQNWAKTHNQNTCTEFFVALHFETEKVRIICKYICIYVSLKTDRWVLIQDTTCMKHQGNDSVLICFCTCVTSEREHHHFLNTSHYRSRNHQSCPSISAMTAFTMSASSRPSLFKDPAWSCCGLQNSANTFLKMSRDVQEQFPVWFHNHFKPCRTVSTPHSWASCSCLPYWQMGGDNLPEHPQVSEFPCSRFGGVGLQDRCF